ncbi:heterokaryon incompatibility protein-domain-containing protein [Xylariaceae sp. FL1272]|nr:heterokaryon incompatibility protein-domain-containing protein [Xylariaceae sp. FL1272]
MEANPPSIATADMATSESDSAITTGTDTFTYHPLSSDRHIRVLVLQYSAKRSDILKGTLHAVSLDDEDGLRYVALSYTWGKPVFSETIILNGSIFRITRNLSEALRQLRQTGRLLIWADAICINQSDDIEKSSQIPVMVDIFRNALHVLAWLGNKQEDVETVKFLQEISRDEYDDWELYWEVPKHWQDAAHSLLNLPYFSRRWIVQELVYAANASFMCGNTELPWPALARALQFCLPPKVNRSELLGCRNDGSVEPPDGPLIVGIRQLWYIWSFRMLPKLPRKLLKKPHSRWLSVFSPDIDS